MSAPDSVGQSEKLRLVALGAAAPQVYELGTARVAVGTEATNDLLLNEPTASRRHAALELRRGRWQVVDLGSTNGTYLNGRRIAAASPAPLERGDELRFGNARFGFVAPGDDLSQVGAGRAKTAVRSRRRGPSRASAVVVAAALFASIGFGLTAYLLRNEHRGRAGGSATQSGALPTARVSAAVGADGGAVGATPAAAGSGKGGESEAAASRSLPTSGSAADAGALGAPASAAEPEWLARLNYYRAMLRLTPVVEDPALSEADTLHARYLVKSYAEAIRTSTIGAEAHEENRASPWYSEKGERAGKSSDVSYWQALRRPVRAPEGAQTPHSEAATWDSPAELPWGSPGWSIDGWIGIPFHRLSLISPYLQRSGYGRYCDGSECAAGLDSLSDLNRFPEHPVPFAQPLEFPPRDGTIGMRSLDSEWPDPLTACSGYARPAGFPITLAIGANVEARLGAYQLTRDGAPSASSQVELESCGFDASGYSNPDAAAQERGRDILHSFGAAVMIPRAPLERGARYTVSMTVNGREYKWTFSTAP